MSDNKVTQTNTAPRAKLRLGFLINRRVTLADVKEAQAVVAQIENGADVIQRFNALQLVQHAVLAISVIVLAVSGLAQTFSDHPLAFQFIQLVGGIDTLQVAHRVFIAVLMLLAASHVFYVLEATSVKLRFPSMLFTMADLKGMAGMVKLFFDPNAELPQFDRYKPDEKFVYWLTVFSVVVSTLTGLVMLFPVQVTTLLPGSIIPFAISIHRWQAILLAVTLLTLHTYQLVRKNNSVNMLKGSIKVDDLMVEHPLEYEWLVRIAQIDETRHFPIHFAGTKETTKKQEPQPETEGKTAQDVTDSLTNVTDESQNQTETVSNVKEEDKIKFNQKLILEDQAEVVDLTEASPKAGGSEKDEMPKELPEQPE